MGYHIKYIFSINNNSVIERRNYGTTRTRIIEEIVIDDLLKEPLKDTLDFLKRCKQMIYTTKITKVKINATPFNQTMMEYMSIKHPFEQYEIANYSLLWKNTDVEKIRVEFLQNCIIHVKDYNLVERVLTLIKTYECGPHGIYVNYNDNLTLDVIWTNPFSPLFFDIYLEILK